MSILITGGAGYIGSHTDLCLLNEGYDIVVVDNYDNSSPEALRRVMELTGKTFPYYEADACDEEKLAEIMKKHGVDSVIHFAGLKAVGESVRIPLRYYENNLLSTIRLLKAMETVGVKKMIFSSSATVYSADNQVPLTETGKLGCTNPYGWTKYMNEQILRDAAVADKELTVVLLRYFNPIGAHPSGLIGEDPNGIPNNLMPYIAKVAVGKLEKVHVFGNDYPTPDGTGVRDYIHVVDLARGHVCAIKKLETNCGLFICNLGTGKGYSVLDVIHAFEKACGKPIPYVIDARRPGDIAECYADPTKAKNELGWVAEYGIEEMCADSWNWQKKNPDGYHTAN